MPFATSSVRRENLGSIRCLVGNWTGNVGDANGSYSVKGGQVYLSNWHNQDSGQTEDKPTPNSISVTTGTITITIYNKQNVTEGRFILIYQ